MRDHQLSLDGPWLFQLDPTNGKDPSAVMSWREATVPLPWQAQFDDLRDVGGVAWYQRTFEAAPAAQAEAGYDTAILHFGAVDYLARVWLNGVLLGEHEGGYLPFEFDVTAALQEGKNELLVRVEDPTDDRSAYPDHPFSEIPHGKQSWYGPIGGIWQSVWLEFRPRHHIADIMVQPAPAEGSIAITVTPNTELPAGFRIACAATNPDGAPAGHVVLDGALSGTLQLDAEPRLWSPETPNLYTVAATMILPDGSEHTVSKACGFRTVAARDGRIYLNGEPLYLRGVLDQGYFAETIYTPNSLSLLEEQARTIKALGFNCLRIHIKIEDPRYYEVADRLGLVVWTEIPNWVHLTDAASRRARETFRAMVARDGHHPSIIAWTLINENWGTDLTRNAEHRQWLKDFYDEAKAIDPTRLVVDNSACCDNAHVAGDLEDFHHYRAIPDHAKEWDEWVADFAGRSSWAWYEDFAGERRGDLPLVVSEFGNWGLPDPAEIQEHGAEPWWFESGYERDGGIVYPHGVRNRFVACGLGDLYPSFAEFARNSQAHMARSLHYEITSMRLHDAIGGYVVTEFTDVHWECNGLLTMQRKAKHLLDPILKEINQDQVVLLRPQSWSGRPGDAVTVEVKTAGVDGQEVAGVVAWSCVGQKGQIDAPGGTITVTLTEPGMATLSARWLDGDGRELARNSVELACVAETVTMTPLRVADDGELAAALRTLGYPVREGALADAAADETVVARGYTATIAEHLHRGGRAVVLADPAQLTRTPANGAPHPLPVGQIMPRAGTLWQGDWATSFAWMRKEGPLAHLPGDPLLEMEWAPLMPDAIIFGIPSWMGRLHSWAGLALGWIHQPVSLLAAIPYGRGHCVLTTFKLNPKTLAENAMAQALFAGLLEM